MTHPFHPLSGRQLVCVGERYNRYGKRLLLQGDDGHLCSVPPQWTDLVMPDPEVTLGGGRALLRLADLLELAELVERLRGEHGLASRKSNHAACVKRNTPLVCDDIKIDPVKSGKLKPTNKKHKLDARRSKRRK